jgi:APA family basic amino acid/polyamine antiporter
VTTARSTATGRFGPLHATALNMSNMIGVGPFITIPLLMSSLGGPQAMLGWLVAIVIAIPDGLVWSELGAAMPGAGGSYLYLREAYGRNTWGRLMAFLFIWQFILSGPLEIASGYIGFARYVRYLRPDLTDGGTLGIAVLVGLLNIALLYRSIRSIAAITVSLWAGTLITAAAIIATGAAHFKASVAFDFPPGAFDFSIGFLFGIGAASRVAIFDYLGYYDICYIGDEVEDPGRVIPRSIIVSIITVAALYLAITLSVIGVVPWRQFVPAEAHPESGFIVSTFMERVYGSRIASVFTMAILWTAFASVFALLLGYSRIPYAAAMDGYFFPVFGRLHPTKRFPHVSLVVIGAIAIVCSFFSLGLVIDALITTRILVQFVGQVVGLVRLRRVRPEMPRPFKMWLYPVPAAVALFGWIFVFLTSPFAIVAIGAGTLAAGAGSFLVWAWRTGGWPFEVPGDHRVPTTPSEPGPRTTVAAEALKDR